MSEQFITKLANLMPIQEGIYNSIVSYKGGEYNLITTNKNEYGSIGEIYTKSGSKYGVICLCPNLLPYNYVIEVPDEREFHNEEYEEE